MYYVVFRAIVEFIIYIADCLFMSLKSKIILASMVIRGVASFGLILYTMVNFTRWLLDHNGTEDAEEL